MKRSNSDPILQDIQRAVKDGYFDEWQPSELLATPVEEIQGRVAMMSDAGRRKHLESIGNQGGGGDAQPPGVFGLPADDALRLLGGGELDSIIQSWPVWQRRTSVRERAGGWLSAGAAGGDRREAWLSRDA
tara:strand:- start:6132 stop:6524 length:393 start_codon:yes stop_codon:yes gene_type:complete